MPTIALLAETGVSMKTLKRVASALDTQIARDVGPAWNVSASVIAVSDVASAPAGSWTITVVDDIEGDREPGLHRTADGRPYALVEWSDDWSLIASHECVEMLIDPTANETIVAPSLEDPATLVRYLLEPCDPCQDPSFSYEIATPDGDVVVSDFVYRAFYTASADAQLSYTGAVESPRSILDGGYVSWFDGVDWWQASRESGDLTIAKIPVTPGGGFLRGELHRIAPHHPRLPRRRRKPAKKRAKRAPRQRG